VYISSSDNTVIAADGKTAVTDLVGIAQSDATGAGQAVDIMLKGITRARMGDTTATYGALLMSGASATAGKLITQTGGGARGCATLLGAAGATTDVPLVMFHGTNGFVS
jgi:hypothetical protein